MNYVSSHTLLGHQFSIQVGFKKFARKINISIYEKNGKYFAVEDTTGANITQGVGMNYDEDFLHETSHKLAMYGATSSRGAIYKLFHLWGNNSLIRSRKSINFIQLKLLKIIH